MDLELFRNSVVMSGTHKDAGLPLSRRALGSGAMKLL